MNHATRLAAPTNPTAGSTVTIGARPVRTDNAAFTPGEPVTLYARRVGGTTYRRIGTQTTSEVGLVTWTDRSRMMWAPGREARYAAVEARVARRRPAIHSHSR